MTTQQAITFRQHLGPEHAGEYVLLPFEVPAGAAQIDIECRYNQAISAAPGAGEGNVLDLALFDSRGAEFGTAEGFRGSSGSARQAVFVAPNDATPGYMPGPLFPGIWKVALGFYKLHPEGCHYEVTVRLSLGPAPEVVPPSWPIPPVKAETRWYRGDLHCHSHHSEATGSLADLCAAAKARGLDFLAVTEHNTVSHHRLLGQFRTTDFVPIPGQEVTTYHGHGNVWGADRWIEFRCRRDADISRVVSIAHAAGALFSVNHPKTNGPPWMYETLARIDCLEVWQGPWFLSNYQSLARWDSLLRNGQRVVGVGGSDLHQPAPGDAYEQVAGQPTTWVYANALEPSAILRAIKAGHVFISAGPGGPQLEVRAVADGQEAMMGDLLTLDGYQPVRLLARVRGATDAVLRLVGPSGLLYTVPITGDDFVVEQAIAAHRLAYVRAEVALPLAPEEANEPAALMVQALGNPIYFRVI